MKTTARSSPGRSSTRKLGAIWLLLLTSFLLTTARQQVEAKIAAPVVAGLSKTGDMNSTTVVTMPSEAEDMNLTTLVTGPSQAEDMNSTTVVTRPSEAEDMNSTTVVAGLSKTGDMNSTTVVTGPSEAEDMNLTTVVTGPSEAEDMNSTTVVTGPSKTGDMNSTTVVTGPSEAEDMNLTTVVTGPSKTEDMNSTTVVTGQSEAEDMNSTTVVTGQSEADDMNSTTVVTGPSKTVDINSTTVVTGQSEAENMNSTAVVTGQSEAEDKNSTCIVTGQSETEDRNSTTVVTGQSEAEDRTCSIVNGPIIIVGGRKAPWTSVTSYSTALFAPAPPPFPVAVWGNTLARVGNKIYGCGGLDSNSYYYRKCWVMDTGTPNATWESFNIEWGMAGHSAVVVQEEIWFFFDSKLRILQTRNGANTGREIDLGFSFYSGTCAVTHGSQTLVIGVGDGRKDVYINNDYTKPKQWERFATLQQGRVKHGCIMFAGEVILTGGWSMSSYVTVSSVEAISVVDGTVRSLAPLGGVREDHQMAIIDGRPAVLGGTNRTITASIEVFDGRKNAWETLGASLGEPRYYFGLTQYFP